jgi:hypothetical protein
VLREQTRHDLFPIFFRPRVFALPAIQLIGHPLREGLVDGRRLLRLTQTRPVCFWEDDGQDDSDADIVRGGPNYTLSLTEARANYARIGACEERVLPHVRPPRPEER